MILGAGLVAARQPNETVGHERPVSPDQQGLASRNRPLVALFPIIRSDVNE